MELETAKVVQALAGLKDTCEAFRNDDIGRVEFPIARRFISTGQPKGLRRQRRVRGRSCGKSCIRALATTCLQSDLQKAERGKVNAKVRAKINAKINAKLRQLLPTFDEVL